MPTRHATFTAWRVTPQPPGAVMDRTSADTARWHRGAAPIVYASTTPELAVLEALAHLEPPYPPHALLKLRFRNVAARAAPRLPPDWKHRKAITRDIGDRWLAAGREMLMLVPSALCAPATNVLVATARLRPGQLRVTRVGVFPFDSRLLKV